MGLDFNNMSVWRGRKLYCAGNRSQKASREKRETEYYGICYKMTVIKARLHFRNRHIFAYFQKHWPKRDRKRERLLLARERERERERVIFFSILPSPVKLPSVWLVLFSWYRWCHHMSSYLSSRRVLLAFSHRPYTWI